MKKQNTIVVASGAASKLPKLTLNDIHVDLAMQDVRSMYPATMLSHNEKKSPKKLNKNHMLNKKY